MSVSTIKSRIVEICLTIPGIEGADRSPRSLVRASLPFVVVLTGEGQRLSGRGDERGGRGYLLTRRLFRLMLLVKPLVAGIEFEAEEACEPFFDAFEDAFGNRPGLYLDDLSSSLADVSDAWLGNDTGVINIELGEKSYAGIVFDLWVDTLHTSD